MLVLEDFVPGDGSLEEIATEDHSAPALLQDNDVERRHVRR